MKMKKIVSVLLAVTVVLSIITIVPFSASAAEVASEVEEPTDQLEPIAASDVEAEGDFAVGAEEDFDTAGSGSTIYFDAGSTGWSGYTNITFYLYEYGGSDIVAQGSEKGNMTDEGNGKWSYNLQENGIDFDPDKLYGCVFSADSGIQTCDLIISSDCIGDTAYCTGETVENAADFQKISYVVSWENADSAVFGNPKRITSAGNVIGSVYWKGETPYSKLVDFLKPTGMTNIDKVKTNTGKTDQQVIDSVGVALGLSREDIQSAIAESGRTFHWNASSSEAIAKPAAPSHSLSNTTDGLKATWGKVANAQAYTVYYKNTANGSWSSFNTTDTSCVIPNTTSGKLYYVQVQSVGANGVRGAYSKVKSMTYLARVNTTGLTYNGSTNTLTWSAVGGANKYQIAKMRVGDSSYTYYTTTSTTFADSSLSKTNTYKYQVRAMYATANNGTAYGAWSATKSVVTMTQPNVTLTNKSNGIRAEWNAVSGATKYIVYYRPASSSTWSSVTTTNTYYPYLNVNSGTLYCVQVRPITNSVSGPFSKVKSMTFVGMPAVTVSNSADGINVSWKEIEGANQYQIAKKKKGASSYDYYTTTSASYIDKAVAGNTEYYYQVRAMYVTANNGTAYGAWSTGKSLLRFAQPNVSLSNKSNGIRAEWNAVSGATKYIVYYRPASSSTWSSVTTTNTYYPYLNVNSGTLYCVQVRPIANSVNGPFSKVKSMTFIGQADAQMSMSGSSPKLSWSAVQGANKYQIAKKKNTASTYEYITTTSTSYIDEAVAGSKDWYTYQIRALYETEDNETAYGSWTSVYNFFNGKVPNGYQTLNGYKYYYKNGVLQKNQIVGTKSEGYYYADGNGVCCVSEEMRLAAEFIMNCATGNTLDERMKTGFKYLAEKFPYKRAYDHPQTKAEIPALAIDMFKNKAGNCFRYAACFTCIAKICGYRARMCVGTTGGSPHGWTEVYMDGKWYYFDPDMQLPSYGYPAYTAYKMSTHPWGVSAKFKTELTISNGKAVWN